MEPGQILIQIFYNALSNSTPIKNKQQNFDILFNFEQFLLLGSYNF